MECVWSFSWITTAGTSERKNYRPLSFCVFVHLAFRVWFIFVFETLHGMFHMNIFNAAQANEHTCEKKI